MQAVQQRPALALQRRLVAAQPRALRLPARRPLQHLVLSTFSEKIPMRCPRIYSVPLLHDQMGA